MCAQQHSTLQSYPTITILSDGRVNGTDLIQREKDVYTFKGDILGTLKVEKDGVTIDGAGYALKADRNGGVMLRKNPGDILMPFCYGGVVVRNVRFCNESCIFGSTQGNSFLNNTFEGGGIDINGLVSGTENIIKYNVFIGCKYAISADYSGVNVVSENNFIDCNMFIALYGGGVMFDRNYWSVYETLYPDAKEIGLTGIWDTPYTHKPIYGFDHVFVDCNPLVGPVAGAGAPEVHDVLIPVPTEAMFVKDFCPIVLMVVFVVFVVVVGIVCWFILKTIKPAEPEPKPILKEKK
ncbi:MAG: right-handed parallel beta-helix repeat-containing protein [Nitrososphaerota archaeon]|nr:right-handed parallel beta-helix repeat-containing protein [Nitrososphaerota archaeon]